MPPIGAAILECLTGLIGIRQCVDIEPESGLYVDDLPGITIEMIQAITKDDNESYLIEWGKIEKQAILTFRTRLLTEVNKCHQIKKMDTVDCLACENKEVLATSLWWLLGSSICTAALQSWNNSRFSTIERPVVEEVRDMYLAEFQNELHASVKAIDVLSSDCVEKEGKCHIPSAGKISIQQTRP